MCCKGKSSPILAFVWKVVRLREYVYFFICAALCQLVLNMCFLVLIFVIALCVYMIVDCGLAFVDFLSRAFNTQNETTAARNAANEKNILPTSEHKMFDLKNQAPSSILKKWNISNSLEGVRGLNGSLLAHILC